MVTGMYVGDSSSFKLGIDTDIINKNLFWFFQYRNASD
jgi:hypothetical protein